ncbi:Uu.00g014060.m01.CDS01 [Anthostomella pinea]|uniref:Uu.00g014060.m01.CDS01 n=1 Tax=Anthostomella pinea TaxID=933095 RepID=A0AAI8VYA9_9PEZI|nr:Uu.00g014060.m01.CDS01 [Anthostomella pinea]
MASRRITAAATLLSLSTLGLAIPAPAFRSLELFDRMLLGRADGPAECSYLLDDTEASMRAVWDDSGLGTGKFLEDWIKEHGEEDWINKIDEDLYATGESSFWCNSLGGANCPDPDDCTKYLDKKVPQLYWILKAGKTHYELANHINDYLQTQTISDTLAIPDIQDKFNNNKNDKSNIFSIISAALVTASAAAGPVPELSALLTLGIGSVGFGNAFAPDELDYTKEISDQLGESFTAAVEGLSVNLNLAMTGRDTKSQKTTADLPNMSGPWSTNIAKYFDGGKFLVANIEAVAAPMLDNLSKFLKQGAVNAILLPQEYFVYIDTSYADSESCAEDGGTRFWVDGAGCGDFWKLDGGEPNVMGKGKKDEEVNNMMDIKYGGFDIAIMYGNAIQCARDHPDGKGAIDPDVNKLPTDGKPAPCFYNYPVFKGKKKHEYGTYYLCNDGDDDINTTGRRASGTCD